MSFFPSPIPMNNFLTLDQQIQMNNLNTNQLFMQLNQQNLIQKIYQNSIDSQNKRKLAENLTMNDLQSLKHFKSNSFDMNSNAANISLSLPQSQTHLTPPLESPKKNVLPVVDTTSMSSADKLSLLSSSITTLFETYPEMDKTIGIAPRSVEEQFCVVFKRSVSTTSKSSNSSYRCRFCSFEFVGGPQKIRVHLTGKRENGTRLSMCHKVNPEVKALMESKMKKSKFTNGQKLVKYAESKLLEKEKEVNVPNVADLLGTIPNQNLETNLEANQRNSLLLNQIYNQNLINNFLQNNASFGRPPYYPYLNGFNNLPMNNNFQQEISLNNLASLQQFNELNSSKVLVNSLLNTNNVQNINNLSQNSAKNAQLNVYNMFNFKDNFPLSTTNSMNNNIFNNNNALSSEPQKPVDNYTSRNEEETHCKIISRNKSPQSKSSNTQYQCIYCNFRFVGGPQKIRVHLTGENEKGTRIQSCSSVPETVKQRMLEKKRSKLSKQ